MKYEGYFKNDSFHGNGKLIFKKGFTQKSIQGDFLNGKPSGQIIETGENYSYEGDYYNGKREGYGKLINENVCSYEGGFKNGKKEGQGTIKLADFVLYRGGFKNDLKEGFGELSIREEHARVNQESPNLNNYIRFPVKTDQPPNPVKYEGNFTNDIFNGKGKLAFQDGSFYQGDFKKGRIEGYGSLVYPDEEVYEGFFKDNMKHGLGKYVLGREGREYKGEFVQDCEVSSKSDFGPRV